MEPNATTKKRKLPKLSLTWIVQAFKKLNSGLNHDFCPGLNRYVYVLKKPLGWTICGAAFSALVGFFIGPQGFVLMWSFLALLVIGAVWPWLCMKQLECRLSFDRSRVQENGLATAIVEIKNKWPIPVFGLMVEGEFLLDLVEDDRVAVGLQRVPAWSVSQFKWAFEPKQRGLLPSDEPKLTNGFPFGLYQSERKIEVGKQTIVWPADCPLRGTPDLDGSQFNIAGIVSDLAGVDGDVIGTRNFREGDALKQMHWAKTARLGQLIVKERQTFAQQPFEVVVDLCSENHRGSGSQSSYEWAIRIAASVCTQLHRHKAEVRLVCLGLSPEHQSDIPSTAKLNLLLDHLATLPHRSVTSAGVPQPEPRFTSGRFKRVFIGTNLSGVDVGGKSVHRIELKCERFGQVEAIPAIDEKPTAPQPFAGIVISSPDRAITDLQTGWSQGMCYES
jgi:uncharacterized protein (DUF58 family)